MLVLHHIRAEEKAAPCVAALGFFDGVHMGHRAVIETARAEAAARGVRCGLFTFEPPTHTTRTVSKSDVRLLQSVTQRESILESLGVEQILCPPFESFYDFTPAEFVQIVLHDTLCCTGVVCGQDYRFGQRGSGDVAMLRMLAEPYGITVTVLAPVLYQDEVVSSTRIRAELAAGRLALAGEMLCTPYAIDAPITQRGNTFLQVLPHGMMPPAAGCYRSRLNGTVPAETEVLHRGTEVCFCTAASGFTPKTGALVRLELLTEK